MNNQATTTYIQLHEVPPKADGTLPANSIPRIKSLACLANSPFYFSVDFTLKELFIALSSTEVNYTAIPANTGLDMTVTVSGEFLNDGSEGVVGDLTTAINTLQVWAEAVGPKRLLRLDVMELLGAARFITIEATDADANVPSGRVIPLAANGTVSGSLGSDGLLVESKSAVQVLSQGCTIRVVDGAAFPWAQTVASVSIRAIYKA